MKQNTKVSNYLFRYCNNLVLRFNDIQYTVVSNILVWTWAWGAALDEVNDEDLLNKITTGSYFQVV